MSTSSTPTESKCPVTNATGSNPHDFCPAQPGQSRSPCPAVNTLANHGYLPRDGKSITAGMVVNALLDCYHVSRPLASAVTYGAFFRLGTVNGPIDLHDLAKHNRIEHNASLVHRDVVPGDEYAPTNVDLDLLDQLIKDSSDGLILTAEDVARSRIRREAASQPPLESVQRVVARSEISAALSIFNNPDPTLHAQGALLQPPSTFGRVLQWLTGRQDDPATTPLAGVPLDRLRYWLQNERLPEGWAPYHTLNISETVATMKRMKKAMEDEAAAEGGKKSKTD